MSERDLKDCEEFEFIKNIILWELEPYIEILLQMQLLDHEVTEICKILAKYEPHREYITGFQSRYNINLNHDNKTNLTFRTIMWYAMKKNPKEFAKVREKYNKDFIRKISESNFSEIKIVEFFSRNLFLLFVYDSVKKELFFYSENEHHWKKDPEKNILNDKVKTLADNELLIELEKMKKELEKGQGAKKQRKENKHEKHAEQQKEQEEEQEGSQGQAFEESLLREICKTIGKLKTITFLNRIVNELQKDFSINNLHELMDSNPALTGTENGVIEVTDKKAIFREGKPEDYIMNCTRIKFNPNPDISSKPMKRLNSWLDKVFIEPEIKDYFLRVCASLLFRRNREKLFFVLTGTGDNSKSAIKRLIELTFGDYCFTLPNALFSKKDRLGPRAELSSARNKAICFIQENDSTDVLVGGKIKELTGNDIIYSRQIYEKAENQFVSFKCFLMCNQVPFFTSLDRALRRRLVIIPFESTWVLNPPKSKSERIRTRQFKLRTDFEEKIPEMAPYFLSMLFKYYESYEEFPLEPINNPKINEKIENFWKKNDPYYIFKKKYLVEDENNNGLSSGELAIAFRKWLLCEFGQKMKQLSEITITCNFEQILGIKCIDGKFMGIRCTYSLTNTL